MTPVRDEAATLEALIAAVRAQTRPPDEWTVVDGGSRDRSVEILRTAGACRVLEIEGNIARGRNAGIAASSGEIIATLDAGCRPRPEWLERLVEPLENDSASVTAGASVPRIPDPFAAAQAAILDQFVMPRWPLRQPASSARSLAFRTELWRRCPFPEWLDHGEDTWLLREWSRRGHDVARVPGALVEWSLRPSVAAVFRQHFTYMRGDGRAAMNSHRHLLRLGFYGLLAALVVAPSIPGHRLQAVAIWSFYALSTAARLFAVTPCHAPGFLARTLVWTLALLPVVDLAKMSGYLAGLLHRVPRSRSRE